MAHLAGACLQDEQEGVEPVEELLGVGGENVRGERGERAERVERGEQVAYLVRVCDEVVQFPLARAPDRIRVSGGLAVLLVVHPQGSIGCCSIFHVASVSGGQVNHNHSLLFFMTCPP